MYIKLYFVLGAQFVSDLGGVLVTGSSDTNSAKSTDSPLSHFTPIAEGGGSCSLVFG